MTRSCPGCHGVLSDATGACGLPNWSTSVVCVSLQPPMYYSTYPGVDPLHRHTNARGTSFILCAGVALLVMGTALLVLQLGSQKASNFSWVVTTRPSVYPYGGTAVTQKSRSQHVPWSQLPNGPMAVELGGQVLGDASMGPQVCVCRGVLCPADPRIGSDRVCLWEAAWVVHHNGSVLWEGNVGRLEGESWHDWCIASLCHGVSCSDCNMVCSNRLRSVMWV